MEAQDGGSLARYQPLDLSIKDDSTTLHPIPEDWYRPDVRRSLIIKLAQAIGSTNLAQDGPTETSEASAAWEHFRKGVDENTLENIGESLLVSLVSCFDVTFAAAECTQDNIIDLHTNGCRLGLKDLYRRSVREGGWTPEIRFTHIEQTLKVKMEIHFCI